MSSPATSSGGADGGDANGSGNGGQGGAPAGGIPDALLERMMDRKLRMLDLEYEECLKATKSKAVEDYDQGPTGAEWDRQIVEDPAATEAGYAPFSGRPTGDPRVPETLGEDEWSEAWAEYRKECAEEEEEARRKGITEEDVRHQTAPDLPPPPPKPLTPASLTTIAQVMSGIKLKPPPWAIGTPDEVWMAQILARAGYRAPGTAPTAAATTATPLTKEKRKKKKKSKAPKPAAPADEFNPVFPSLDASPAATTATNPQLPD